METIHENQLKALWKRAEYHQSLERYIFQVVKGEFLGLWEQVLETTPS